MTIKLGPMNETAMAAAVPLISEAFFDDPLFRYWCGEAGMRYERRVERFAAILNQLQRDSGGHCIGAYDGDRLVGLAFVKDGESMSNTKGVLGMLLNVLFRCGAMCLWRFIKVGKALPAFWPKSAHLYLTLLAVSPASQGQGAGRQLLAAVSAYAEQQGLPEVCLDTQNPNNVGYYSSDGYRIIGEPVIDTLQSWCMLRRVAAEETTAS